MSRSAVLSLLALPLLAGGCPQKKQPEPAAGATPEAAAREFTVLHLNDVYRIAGLRGPNGNLARVRTLRTKLESEGPVLVTHAGDLLGPSVMSRTYDGEQMVDVLNLLDGRDDLGVDEAMWVVFGNHEFDAGLAPLQARVQESKFRWLDTNITWAKDDDDRDVVRGPLQDTRIITVGDVRVGLFGVTIDIKEEKGDDLNYVTAFGDYIETAKASVKSLRDAGAEVVLGVTHLNRLCDMYLLDQLRGVDGPDAILGGHDHVWSQDEWPKGSGRWVIKGDADAAKVAVVTVTVDREGAVSVSNRYQVVDADIEEDHDVQTRIDEWKQKHNSAFCTDAGEAEECLDEQLARTDSFFVAEELEIRAYETSGGNWLADLALSAGSDAGAQIAFMNSGSLRLNENVPAGNYLTRRDVEGIFQYPSDLVVVEVTGEQLQAIVDQSVSQWPGSGHWLQIAGFAYKHDVGDPTAAVPTCSAAGGPGTATNLTLMSNEGPITIGPKDKIKAVTGTYLAGGGDGYSMLAGLKQTALNVDLKDLALSTLRDAEAIGPTVDGRICSSDRGDGPCLAQ